MNYFVARSKIAPVLDVLREAMGEDHDERLILDTLDGETDFIGIVRDLLTGNEDDEGAKDVLKEQIDVRRGRIAAADKRIDARKKTIAALMDVTGLAKIPLPEATISVRQVAPKPIVTEPESLRDEYCRIKREPDMEKIKEAVKNGELPTGVSFDNGGTTISIRRK